MLRYILLLDKEISNSLHIKVCRRNGVETDSITNAESLGELLNIICCSSCHSCESFAQLSTSVPQILNQENFTFSKDEKAILVSLISPYGQIRFVLSFSWED